MPKFLIVDDEPVMRSVLKATLRRLRPTAEFAEAGSAYDASFAFDDARFDAVFLDMDLAGGPGGLFATSMLKHKIATDRIVLVTSLPADEPRVKAAVARGTGYMQKPVRAEDLNRVLADLKV